VRPGGLIVFLTNWGTLDKGSATVRRLLHAEAELLGAFRLPSGVFAETSGSSSGADLVILRKRRVPAPAGEEPAWLQIAPVDYPRISGGQQLNHGSSYTSPVEDSVVRRVQRIQVNQHWIDHPEAVIGAAHVVDQDRSLWLQVTPLSAGAPRTLAAALDRALPPTQWQTSEATAPAVAAAPAHVPAAPATPRSLEDVIDRMDARERPQFEALADLYPVAKRLLAAELAGAADAVVDALRADLNRRYDQIVGRWGIISHPRLTARLRHVPELRFVQALETNARPVKVDQWRADKAAIFTTRTVRPHQAALPGALTVDEALAYALNERGGVDLDRIAFLSGLSSTEAQEALADRTGHRHVRRGRGPDGKKFMDAVAAQRAGRAERGQPARAGLPHQDLGSAAAWGEGRLFDGDAGDEQHRRSLRHAALLAAGRARRRWYPAL
jgi:hypothetical protein